MWFLQLQQAPKVADPALELSEYRMIGLWESVLRLEVLRVLDHPSAQVQSRKLFRLRASQMMIML